MKKLAVLGPKGTYSDIAARKYLNGNDEYEIEINFKDNNIKVKYADNYEGVTSLIYSKVTKDNHNITITYQIDENEPINKVIIARKD